MEPVSHSAVLEGAWVEQYQANFFAPIQIVVMIRNDGDGWLHGKSGEEEGLFPENYVERVCSV